MALAMKVCGNKFNQLELVDYRRFLDKLAAVKMRKSRVDFTQKFELLFFLTNNF